MATMSTEEILKRLRELKPQIIQTFRAKEIQLFGSNARREQNPESDIDVHVDFEDGADLFHLTGLAIFLEDELQRKVDVVFNFLRGYHFLLRGMFMQNVHDEML